MRSEWIGRRLALGVLLLAACARPVAVPSEDPGGGLGTVASSAAALRVASSGDYAPFSFLDASGQRRGLDIDVAQRFAAGLARPIAWLPLRWPGLDAETARAGFDVAMSGVTLRADRALVGRFTRSYASTGALVIVRQDDAARLAAPGALDRPAVRLAVNGGGHLERLARQRFPHATLLPQADNARVPQALRDGSADAAVTDSAEAHHWLTPALVALPPFSVDYKAYLLPVAQAELASRLDVWLMAREADGWLNAARVRWLGDDASMDAAAAARTAIAGLVRLRLELMPGVAAAKRAANLPIEDRAQEARVLERVRAQVAADPARAAAVFGELIEMAKTVQRTAPPMDDAPTLDVLRAALGRIDATLCRELNALPGLPGSSAAQWRETLAPALGDRDAAQLSGVLAR